MDKVLLLSTSALSVFMLTLFPHPTISVPSSGNILGAEKSSLNLTPSPTLDYIVITETPIPTNTPRPTSTPTPTPSPRPTAIPISAGDLEDLFKRYAEKEGIDVNIMKKIANCESHFHTGSVNGDYAGMFQFASQTWINTRQDMGENTDVSLRFNGEESIKTAAFKIRRQGTSPWSNCAK